MELFSEIYSRYYKVAEIILEAAGDKGLTEQKINQLITAYGFGESNLFLLSKLLDGEYKLLEQKGTYFFSKVSYPVGYPLSNLQKSFLRALLDDPRIFLFLTKKQYSDLKSALKGIEPLFSWKDFYYFDRFAEGDPYNSEEYQRNFQVVFEALKQHQVLKIYYQSRYGKKIRGIFAPYRLQYSQKNDCFRLLCIQLKQQIASKPSTINMARILEVSYSLYDYPFEIVLKIMNHQQNSKDFVMIEIYNERNALERCMLHFANYEKQTSQIKPDVYHCKIFYNKEEETELLIRVLSFGPVIRVLSPASFLNQMRERIAKQMDLINNENPFTITKDLI